MAGDFTHWDTFAHLPNDLLLNFIFPLKPFSMIYIWLYSFLDNLKIFP